MTQHFSKTRDAARGRWKSILMHFGIDESYLRKEHGPCPICEGKDRFRWDDINGDGTYYCSSCEPGTGMRLLMMFKNWTFPKAAAEVDQVVGNFPECDRQVKTVASDKREIMNFMYRGGRPVSPGDPVWRYLDSRCGDPSGVIQELRFHPDLKHSLSGTTHPAMMAMMRPHGATKAIGIHRTYLTFEGRKANVNPVRMSYGEWAPVRLGPAKERLGIAEGIETAICAGKLHGLPVWSATSANGILAWQPPELVRSVVIFGDNDANFVGQAAAYEKAKELRLAGLEVEIQIPKETGTDWCDVWCQSLEVKEP